MMAGADTTTIGRARVAGWPDGANRLAARLALAQTLASADLRPPGLSPAAVLLVRRLSAVDKPLRLGVRVDPAWERAGRRALADLARSAIRPWDGLAPSDCMAVLFRDEAEMLACLALDVSLGRAAERWWWQMIPGRRRWGALTPDILAALLAESPQVTPAALRMLAERDAAQQVLRRMTPSEALLVLREVCNAFDAPHLAQAAAAMGRQLRPSAATGSQSQLPAPDAAPVPSGEPARGAPPWQAFTSSQAHRGGLAPHAACLLGVSLALAQAPAAARSVGFAQAVEHWWRGQAALRVDGGQPESHATAEALGAAVGAQGAAASPSPAASALAGPVAVLPPPAVAAGSELPPFAKGVNSDPAPVPAPPQDVATGSPVAGRISTSTEAPVRDQHVAAESAAPAHIVVDPEGVATGLGGVLFLINVMQRLDLPDCFEPAWRLASQVGPWGMLELLGRALLAGVERSPRLPTFLKVGNLGDPGSLANDPLWAALAALAGREPGVAAGAGVDGPGHVDIPASWAQWLGHESVAGRRVDLAGVEALEGPLLDGASLAVRRWLAVVTPLLRAMLTAALNDSDDDPVAGLLLRRGRLFLTPSHVDLVLPLEGVSLPARLAGLDFDPGWLPAYGRVVQFHFS